MKTQRTPTRKEITLENAWDLTPLYADIDAWEKEVQSVVPRSSSPFFPQIASFQTSLCDSPETLKNGLDVLFSIERQLRKLYTWAHLKHDEDLKETVYKSAYERIDAYYHIFAEETSWIEPEILSLNYETLQGYVTDPTLSDYHFFLEKLFRLKPHTLAPPLEKLLASAEQPLGTPHKTFSAINDADFRFPKVKNSQGKELELTHGTYGLYLRDPDRELRRNAFLALHEKYQEFENTMASLLAGQVQKHVFYAKTKNYSSALEAALYPKNIDVKTYETLIEAVHENIHELHKYMKVRKRLLGVPEMHMWDLYVPLVPSFTKKYSFDEARELVIASTEPLGSPYQQIIEKGLKQERWVDRYENQNKRSGAYSSGCYDSHPYILMNFRGLLNDVFTLAHEGGHSMHSFLSRTHQPYQYADYSIFVAEVASTFNEELLMQLMLNKASSKQEKAFLLNQKIEDIRATLFRQTMFAEFELTIHKLQEANVPLTPELLKQEFLRLNQFYFGPDVVIDPEIAIEWARIPHFYYNFYVFQYATGISAALSLADQVRSSKEARDRYLGFLQAGSSDFPLEILKKAGIDMRSRKPVEDTIQKFSHYVDEFEKLMDN